MNAFLQELKISLQSLRKKTGFVITVVITLGVTFGALITFFNLNHVLLIKSLPYPDYERLQFTQHMLFDDKGEKTTETVMVPGLVDMYKTQQSFEAMTIFSKGQEFLTSHREQPKLSITFTTPEYFQLLAVPMVKGRGFSEEAGLDANNPVAVISHHSWKTWFNGRNDVIGTKLRLRDTSYTIVGVAADNFIEPEVIGEQSDIWAPWDFNGMNELVRKSWNNGQTNIGGLGKLRSLNDFNKEQAALSQSQNSAYQNFLDGADNPLELDSRLGIKLEPIKARLLGDSHKQALLLMAAVFGLLIIASANVINLFYSRAAEKQRTFAIQAALGARKKHLFNSMFAESLILTLTSGALGLIVALWGIDLVKDLGKGQINRLQEMGFDLSTVFFAIVISVVLAVIFALLSSRVVNYEKLQEQLQSSGKGSGLQISSRKRNILVVSQIFLASLLLVGASMVLGKALHVINQPLGYDESVLHSFSLDERAGLIEDNEIARREQLIKDIVYRLEQLPQVASLSPSFNTSIGYNMIMTAVDRDNNQLGSFPANFVDSKYFQTIQVPIIEGRAFTDREVRERAPVAILSRSAAEKVANGGSALGLKMTIGGGQFRTIVGVVENVYDPVRSDVNQYHDAYLPYAPWNIHFVMQLRNGADLSRHQLVSLIQDVNPNLRLANYNSFVDRHDYVLRQDKITAGLAGGLSILALLLAGTGIFGVLSYSSHMRRYELGVRMALGAKAKQIITLVIKDNMKPIIMGLTYSIVVLAAIYFVGKYQFGLFNEYNLVPIAVTFPVILLTAFMASYLPVRNVLSKEPMKALRNEGT